jgi:hypothetical protein
METNSIRKVRQAYRKNGRTEDGRMTKRAMMSVVQLDLASGR